MGAGNRMGDERDFPYYAGWPIRLSAPSWIILLTSAVAGFSALMLFAGPSVAYGQRLVGVGLFVLLPLIGLRLAAAPAWSALFRRPTAKDVWIGLAFAPLTILVSGAAAVIAGKSSVLAGNPALVQLGHLPVLDLTVFLLSTLPQLLGEELATAIPFLALLTLFNGPLRATRWFAILLAWLGAALIFGALHLSTYQWHLAQAFGVIGAARMVLWIPYLITKNLWSSTIAHVVNDWTGFALVISLSIMKGEG